MILCKTQGLLAAGYFCGVAGGGRRFGFPRLASQTQNKWGWAQPRKDGRVGSWLGRVYTVAPEQALTC